MRSAAAGDDKLRIAFYAPLKAPTHPVPSGDRLIARLLMRAMESAGHEVQLVSTFRSRDGAGDGARQRRIRDLGLRLAERFLRRLEVSGRAPPECWFTYHLYHKAPDWLGPRVSTALGLPYVVAEASVAAKRAGGAWDLGYRASLEALARADTVIALNSSDVPGLRAVLDEETPLAEIPPFLDDALLRRVGPRRAEVATEYALPDAEPWLVAAAMMRPGNKEDSFRFLARALRRLLHRPWRIFLVGDGARRGAVERCFADLPPSRLRFTGALALPALARIVAACDLFVWPALDEPLGMAMLEAQGLGVPVVSTATRGVVDVVEDGATGLLVASPSPSRFARAVDELLGDGPRRRGFAAAARRRVAERHSLAAASKRLGACIVSAAVLRAERARVSRPP